MPASPFLLLCLDYILAASQEFRQVDGCFELKSVGSQPGKVSRHKKDTLFRCNESAVTTAKLRILGHGNARPRPWVQEQGS